MGAPGDTSLIDFSHDREQNDGREVDAETQVSAASVAFNNAVLPPGMPEWLKATIRADADAIVAAMQDDADRLTIAEARGDEERESLDTMWQMTAAREQREREEWARTQSSVGGVTMTGDEWAALATRLRDDAELHRRIIDAFKKRGMLDAEAEARYQRVTDVADAMAVPPSQRTEQQKQDIAKADADPTFKRDVATANDFANDRPDAARSDINWRFTQAAAGVPAQTAAVATPTARPVVTVDGPGL